MARFARFLYHVSKPLGPRGHSATLCPAHRRLAKDIAVEGTVLLKNDGLLPLAAGTRLCPFGNGIGNFLFGGGGSGFVVSDRMVTLTDALRAEANLDVFTPLLDFYRDNAERNPMTMSPAEQLATQGLLRCPELPEGLYTQAKAFGGVALLCVSRFSTESNTFDRSGAEGDFLLWPEEQALFDRLRQDFTKVLVILNVCGPVSVGQFKDCDRVGAILYPMQGGSYAGEAIVDILLGRRYPSGRLTDTLADRIEDYPSTSTFRESEDFVNYEEDIFVGYRYFESLAQEKVLYPFGYGLGYTDFKITCKKATFDGRYVVMSAAVQNIGNHPGKEVVQVYLSAPQGLLGKAHKVLATFQKTRELKPGEETLLTLRFDLQEFASYDDTGAVSMNAFVLEAGEYIVSLGANVRDCVPSLYFSLKETVICRHCRGYMAPCELPRRLRADGSWESLPPAESLPHPAPNYKNNAEPFHGTLAEALAQKNLDGFLNSLSNEDLGHLLHGHVAFHAGGTGGIGYPPIRYEWDGARMPLVPTADGPAGFRASEKASLCTTYFPCATTLAQSWDPTLARRMGKAGALELKESCGGIWLAPALNIHRNPMCGRNFEYYSEDPLVSGVFAAAFVRGVQSQGVAATVKHFCGNNKELNRLECDSRISQRALREIYLKAFEITIKKGNPWCLMTSYNRVNGVRSSANWESIQGILRNEWRYKGLVMTDWGARSTIEEDILAGSQVKMPSADNYGIDWYDFSHALEAGILTRENLLDAARRVLQLIDHFE